MTTLEVIGSASMAFVAAFTWIAASDNGGDGQTSRVSIIEAWVNIVIGFAINLVVNFFVAPLAVHNGRMDAMSNWWMTWSFTSTSLVRQFVIRRWFNARVHSFAIWLAAAF